MKLRLLLLTAALGACTVHSGPGPAARRAEQRDDTRDHQAESMTGWEKLGERWVQGGNDHDSIHVGRKEGRFTRIQLKVEHSALELYDVVVHFGDGSTWSPGVRMTFGQGSTTRVIDLPGRGRVIRRVEFRYGNLPGGGRAQLELWGS